MATIGSIPACAGEPSPAPAPSALAGVYPRLCGGTPMRPQVGCSSIGLSPPVRGNRLRRQRHVYLPAVYPRLCGGTRNLIIGLDSTTGLSPPVRGNLVAWERHTIPPGSIPACAGEPCVGSPMMNSATVYPRLCGGTAYSAAWRRFADGLSPPVRGNQAARPSMSIGIRSIPACAGEPSPAPAPSALAGVYPRLCGGTLAGLAPPSSRNGLSPPVRGNLVGQPQHQVADRSIPACAGEPC